MNKDKVVLREGDTIERAIELILRHCRTGVPVLSEDNRVCGFVSEEDIIKKCLPGYITTLKNAASLPDYGQFAKRFAAIRCVSRAYLIRSMILEKNREEKAVLKYE